MMNLLIRQLKLLARLRAVFLVSSLLPILLAVSSHAGQFKVTRIYDGDTVKAEGHDIEIKVRLVGIDAPEVSHKKREPGQPYGREATRYLASMVLNKVVDIKGYGTDQYSRVLGVIFIDGKNVNLEMVKAGLAEVYRGKPPHGFDLAPYQRAEQEAQQARRRMWSLGSRYVSPKEWRKKSNSPGSR